METCDSLQGCCHVLKQGHQILKFSNFELSRSGAPQGYRPHKELPLASQTCCHFDCLFMRYPKPPFHARRKKHVT